MIADALPMVSLSTGLLIALVCFAAAIVGAMSGFGSGLIISAAVAPILGVKAVVPVISVAMIIANAARIWVYRDQLDRRTALVILASAIPASVLGAFVYVHLDPRVVAGVFGVMLLASVPFNRTLRKRAWSAGPATLGLGGATFGFLSSNALGAGLLIIPMLMGAGLVGPAIIATDAAIAVGTSLFRVAAFSALDALTWPLALIGVLMGLCTIPGAWMAAWVIRRTDMRLHTVLIEVFVIIAGLGFLWQAWSPG